MRRLLHLLLTVAVGFCFAWGVYCSIPDSDDGCYYSVDYSMPCSDYPTVDNQ